MITSIVSLHARFGYWETKKISGSKLFFQVQTGMQDVSVKLSDENPGITFTDEDEEETNRQL